MYDPTTFKDAPPLASIPLTTGSTIAGPTGPAGPAYGPIVGPPIVNATTDAVIDRGLIGPKAPAPVAGSSKA
jgi:hypothetical protein